MNIKTLFFPLCTWFIVEQAFPQMTVGANTAPNSASVLDLSNASTLGLYPPQVALISTNAAGPVLAPPKSLLVYNINTAGTSPYNVLPGYYYNAGTPALPDWVRLLSGNNSLNDAWLTSGNGGTNATTDFIGTTDDNALKFKVNNILGGYIDPANSIATFGRYAGNIGTTTATNLTAFGSAALKNNTSGINNTSVGDSAMATTSTGSNNTSLGYKALSANSIGTDNTGIGNVSLAKNLGNGNSALGSGSLAANTNGAGNLALGYQSLNSNLNASGNTAAGFDALELNVGGTRNTAVGFSSLLNNIVSDNTGLGYNSLMANTFGIGNTSVGSQSLAANISGNGNTGSGYEALFANTIASNNTAAGYQTLEANTIGVNNTAVGSENMQNNISGSQNTALGYSALASQSFTNGGVSYATDNTAIGFNALTGSQPTTATNGIQNTAVGSYAIAQNTTGAFNTGIGYQSLTLNATALNNTAVGWQSLYYSTSGNNTAIGAATGLTNTTGSNNTFVGYLANAGAVNLINATAIGANAVVGTSNALVLGGTGANAVNVGINTASPNAAAILDLSAATAKGIYPTQVALSSTLTSPIPLPPTSLLIYNTATAGISPNNVTPGYYYNSGTPLVPIWIRFLAGTPATGTVTSVTSTGPIIITGLPSIIPNITLQGTAGGVMYGTGAGSAFTAAGTSGQVLQSNVAAAPSWVSTLSPNLALGQSSVTVYGSASLTVTGTTGYTLIPGLTQAVTVPANCVVNIGTDGGIQTTSVAAGAMSIVDIAILVDGANVANGGYQRINAINGTSIVNTFAFWSQLLTLNLAAGSHTIAVYTVGYNIAGNANATVGGPAGNVLQPELTVTIIKK